MKSVFNIPMTIAKDGGWGMIHLKERKIVHQRSTKTAGNPTYIKSAMHAIAWLSCDIYTFSFEESSYMFN